jgi:hypothetical protein
MRFGIFDHLDDDRVQFSQLFKEQIMQAYIARWIPRLLTRRTPWQSLC